MASPSTIAALRFGAGLSPRLAAPEGAEALMADLTGPDRMAKAWPMITTAEASVMYARYSPAKKADKGTAATMAVDDLKGELNAAVEGAFRATAARWLDAETGFRERLTSFWSDHFSVRARNARHRAFAPAFVSDAIRPHVAGRFGDMLKAAVTHPMMLVYLDQVMSFGPHSAFAKRLARKDRVVGLNENLGREVLELHTLGVGGAYVQDDVRQLAELLTGLGLTATGGTEFRDAIAEPGTETVLGRTYGGDPAKLADVHAALDDLAVHPDTARHIARKLAVHFVADEPDAGLLDAMTRAFQASGGDLTAVCRAMLDHDAAWAGFGSKVRQPFDYVLTGMRALGLRGQDVMAMRGKGVRFAMAQPMRLMGQPWLAPEGPDGWPEAAADWVTPQGMAARIDWAMQAPASVRPDLPDPRGFVAQALGDAADEALIWAADKAETKEEGVGLILASPAFNRR